MPLGAPRAGLIRQRFYIVTAGLVGEWRFNDGSGQQLTDYSGLGNHCELGPTSGADTDEPAWIATGLGFPGTANGYARGTTALVAADGVWSACFVIKGASQDDNRFFSEGNTGSSNQIMGFGTGGTTDGDHPKIFVRNSSNTIIVTETFTTLVAFDSAWHFLAIRVNGTAVKCYLDGSSATSTETGGTTGTLNMLAIGTLAIGGAYSSTGAWTGDIAWAAAYSTALTDAEVNALRQYARHLVWSRGITLP